MLYLWPTKYATFKTEDNDHGGGIVYLYVGIGTMTIIILDG